MKTQAMLRQEALLIMLVCRLMIPAPASAQGAQPGNGLAPMTVGPAAIEWRPGAEYERAVLTVSRPSGSVLRRVFSVGSIPSLDLRDRQGNRLPDGRYTYELRIFPPVDKELRNKIEAARAADDEAVVTQLQEIGEIPHAIVQSGYFSIRDGSFVTPGLPEAQNPHPKKSATETGLTSISSKDVVANDDLIGVGNSCIGINCANGESFGSDTLRLKADTLRIKFLDTSTAAGFPTNDWQLTANDSTSGGAEKFSIDDVTGVKTPFTILAGAPNNSLFVNASGKVGVRTATPAQDVHIISGNTPAVRMEQDGSGGLTPRAWDLAGNEVGFSVKDVTNGSAVPFRVRAGAPTSSVEVAANGNVGIGTASPAAALDVSRSTGALALVLRLANNKGIQVLFDRTDAGAFDWQMSNFSTSFQVSIPGSATPQFNLDSNGNLTIGGTQYLTGSSRELKENFIPVDGVEILRRLADMPLTEWNAKVDPMQRHIGPVAEDWWATFGLGPDDQHVSMTDVGGVALAAIKGLNAELKDKDRKIAELEERIEILERLLQPQPKVEGK